MGKYRPRGRPRLDSTGLAVTVSVTVPVRLADRVQIEALRRDVSVSRVLRDALGVYYTAPVDFTARK